MIPGTTSLDSTLEFLRLCIVVLDREAVLLAVCSGKLE